LEQSTNWKPRKIYEHSLIRPHTVWSDHTQSEQTKHTHTHTHTHTQKFQNSRILKFLTPLTSPVQSIVKLRGLK